MTKPGMRASFGISIVICHLALFGLIFLFYLRGGFSLDELLTSLGLMAPMFASFVGVVVDEITSSPLTSATTTQQLRGGFVFLSWLFLVCYTAFMATIIVLRSYNIGIRTFDAFKALIAVGETACGIYLARFIKVLFEKS
jgi:hypothetical protein